MSESAFSSRLCITGSFGFGDIGDEAMLTETLDFLLTVMGLRREQVHLFGHSPDYIAWYHQHPRENCHADSELWQRPSYPAPTLRRRTAKWALDVSRRILLGAAPEVPQPVSDKRIQAIADESDCLIVTGGGTINTRDVHGHSINRMHGLVKRFRMAGKPVFFCAQTFGPLGVYEHHDQMAREIVEAADWVFARDTCYSRRYLDLLGCIPAKFVETYDDATSLPYDDAVLPPCVSEFLDRGQMIALNVTLYTADTDEKCFFIAELAGSLIREFDANLVFLGHTPWDLSALWRIHDMVDNRLKGRILVPDTRRWRDKQLKKLISLCQLAVGGRYHFLIFAGGSDTPFIGMSGMHYSYIKNDGFARIFGYEDFILDERKTWNLDSVLDTARKAIAMRVNIKSRITRPSPTMVQLGKWLRTIPASRQNSIQ